MNRITGAAAALALAVAVTVCGSSTPPKPPAISSLVHKVGCTGFGGGNEILTRENGTCDIPAGSVDLATFTTASQQDQWVKAAISFGSGVIITGHLWAAGVDNQQAADAVKAKLGGSEH